MSFLLQADDVEGAFHLTTMVKLVPMVPFQPATMTTMLSEGASVQPVTRLPLRVVLMETKEKPADYGVRHWKPPRISDADRGVIYR